jgi:hypothetical protein
MKVLWFWKDWPGPYRALGSACFLLIIASLLYYLTGFAAGKSLTLSLDTFHDQQAFDLAVRNVEAGPFVLPVTAKAVYFFEFFGGGEVAFLPWAHYLALTLFLVVLVLFLTLLTGLEKTPYYGGMLIVIAMILFLRPDEIGFAVPWSQAAAVICLLVYVPLSFYFFAFRRQTSVMARLLSFAGTTLLLLGAAAYFSLNESPLLRLSVLTIRPLLLVAMMFIALVAHQVVAFFVFMVSYSAKSGKSLNHFLIITAIYLLNLWLVYWTRVGFIPWTIDPINEFVLLAVSALLGIWGYGRQEATYGHLFLFRPWGFLFYTCLAVATFSLAGMSFLEYNDPVISLLEDWILYTHLGFSLIFLLYVFSNFVGPLAQNLPVHRVLYVPNRMPYITYRLAGIAALLAFVFYNDWHDLVYKGLAGHYNAQGDVERHTGNRGKSVAYYRIAAATFLNRHANYSLALDAGANQDYQKELEYLQNARYVPSLEISLNRSNAHRLREEWFRALFALQEARKEFDGPAVWNNLGYLHALIGTVDSARYFLRRSEGSRAARTASQTNLIALALKERDFRESVQSRPSDDAPLLAANLTALAGAQGKFDVDYQPPSVDTVLNLYTASWLSNYLLSSRLNPDSLLLRRAVELAALPSNERFSESLLFATALIFYESGNVAEALRLLSSLTFRGSDSKGKYQTIMGLWSLDQRQPVKAVEHLEEAVALSDAGAYYPLAIAYTEARQFDSASMLWDSLTRVSDSTLKASAVTMIRVLNHKGSTQSLSEYERYLYARYRASTVQQQLAITESISTEELQTKLLLETLQEMLDTENEAGRQLVYQRLSSVLFRGEHSIRKARRMELRMAALAADTTAVQGLLSEADFEPGQLSEKTYFDLIARGQSEDPAIRRQEYEVLGRYNLYFTEGVVAAARYFVETEPESHTAYAILVDAVQASPHSVRVLKAYILEAARIGYSRFAEQGFRMLEQRVGKSEALRFRKDNPSLEAALAEAGI